MAFAYDHDCPFEVFITNLGKYNEGNLVGEWVKFPTTEEELKRYLKELELNQEHRMNTADIMRNGS